MNILFLLSFDLSEIGSLILELLSLLRGVARGGSWGARDPPLVGLLLSKRKRHDNILAVKAIVEKPTFFKFVFL